jgi:hypothetical protein
MDRLQQARWDVCINEAFSYYTCFARFPLIGTSLVCVLLVQLKVMQKTESPFTKKRGEEKKKRETS